MLYKRQEAFSIFLEAFYILLYTVDKTIRPPEMETHPHDEHHVSLSHPRAESLTALHGPSRGP